MWILSVKGVIDLRNYKLGMTVLIMLIILVLVIIGQFSYYVYDQQRIVTYDQALEREDEDLSQADRIEVRTRHLSEENRFAFEEDPEVIKSILEEPEEMRLQKTSGFSGDVHYTIFFSSPSTIIYVAENELGIGSETYSIKSQNILLDLVRELEEDLEWEKY